MTDPSPTTSERKARRVIEMVVGPCTRDDLDKYLSRVAALIDQHMPELAAAVAGRYSADTPALQRAAELALVELEPEGGTDPWRDLVIQQLRAALSVADGSGSPQRAPRRSRASRRRRK